MENRKKKPWEFHMDRSQGLHPHDKNPKGYIFFIHSDIIEPIFIMEITYTAITILNWLLQYHNQGHNELYMHNDSTIFYLFPISVHQHLIY